MMRQPISFPATRSWGIFMLACLLMMSHGVVASPASEGGPASAIRRVVVVHFDTVRVDDIGCYGGAAQTPNVDALAARGMRYTNAVTCMPFTRPSIASFLTGTYPKQHGIKDGHRKPMNPQLRTLPALLSERGFDTGAFVSNPLLQGHRSEGPNASAKRQGKRKGRGEPNAGFYRGFDTYEFIRGLRFKREAPASSVEATGAAEVTRKALEFVRARSEERFFLWLLYLDPHTPYRPPVDLAGKELLDGAMPTRDVEDVAGTAEMIARHLGEVSVVDRCLDDLFTLLDSLAGKTLIMVLSDHGESLGDAEYWFGHGRNIRYPCMKVPFIIQCDGVVPAGVSHALVDNTDIAPTILDLLGSAEHDPQHQGRSLIPTFSHRDPWPERIVPMRTLGHELRAYRGARSAYYSFQCGYDRETGSLGAITLYDHRSDPYETANLAELHPQVTKEHLDFVRDFFAIGEATEDAPAMPADPEMEEALRALGYLE